MNPRRQQILHEMGLGPLWKLRAPPVATMVIELPAEAIHSAAAQVPTDVVPTTRVASIAMPMGWDELAATVAACRQCRLCEARKQAVLGVGDGRADWFFVGEGLGAEEDECGEPFVGQAGQLLDNMLASIDLQRGRNVYIANAVKCRPPENRTPDNDELAACRPYLAQQIALIQPKLIVAMGRPAAQTLLQAEVKIGAARGKLHAYEGIPVIVTYHPAYLLRSPADKRKAWEDVLWAVINTREFLFRH